MVAMMLSGWEIHNDLWPFGLIGVFLGVGMFLFYALTRSACSAGRCRAFRCRRPTRRRPGVPVAALVAVPLSFIPAITMSRRLPGRGLPGGLRMCAF